MTLWFVIMKYRGVIFMIEWALISTVLTHRNIVTTHLYTEFFKNKLILNAEQTIFVNFLPYSKCSKFNVIFLINAMGVLKTCVINVARNTVSPRVKYPGDILDREWNWNVNIMKLNVNSSKVSVYFIFTYHFFIEHTHVTLLLFCN